MAEDCLFLTSDGATIAPYFDGYAYFGQDFVLGEENYRSYLSAGNIPEFDADGAYVNVENLGGGLKSVSTDFRGYRQLYLYRNHADWAIGDSLVGLASGVADCGWPLTERQHQTEIFRSKRAFALQTTSSRTPFEEIVCIPYDSQILIKDKEVSILPKSRELSKLTYEQALGRLVQVWSGRIISLLDSGMGIRLDLTGGIDSRVVLAVMLHSLRNSGKEDYLGSESIYFNSDHKKIDDFRVAKILAERFSFTLNKPISKKNSRASGKGSFESWLKYNVGRYSPHLLPPTNGDAQVITFPGVGGEEHRPFFEKFNKEFTDYVRGYKPVFKNNDQYDCWKNDLFDDLKLNTSEQDRVLPMSIMHYRRHRGRHHASKQPGSEVMGVILASKYFYDVTSKADISDIENNQVLFDVINSTCPELLHIEFDSPSKSPSNDNLARLRKGYWLGNLPKGQSWHNPVFTTPENELHRNEVLRQNVERAMNSRRILDRLGNVDTFKVFEQLNKLGTGNMHEGGQMLHYVMLLDILEKYCNKESA